MIDPAAQACEVQELSTYWFIVGTMAGVLVVLLAIVLTDRK